MIKPTWEQLTEQAQNLFQQLAKPAAQTQPPVFINIDDPHVAIEDVSPLGAEYLCDLADAEAIYQNPDLCPPSLTWALGLALDEFVEAYLAWE